MIAEHLNTLSEAAAKLRVSLRTLYAMRINGEIEVTRVHKKQFITDSAINDYLQKQKGQGDK